MATRQRSLIVPREHGAWGILLIPLVTGACAGIAAGGTGRSLAPLALVALSLFWLRTPVESWLGSSLVRARTAEEQRLVRKALISLAILSLPSLVWLFWGGRNLGLFRIGAAAAIGFLGQSLLKRTGRTAAQMIGSAGLTATAPAAYYVATGHLDATALALWAANLLFAINQIQFVQLRIHTAKLTTRSEKLSAGWPFLAAQLISMALILAACVSGWLPWLAAAAFLPILGRGFAWFAAAPQPLAVHALGKSELAYACGFGLVLAVSFI